MRRPGSATTCACATCCRAWPRCRWARVRARRPPPPLARPRPARSLRRPAGAARCTGRQAAAADQAQPLVLPHPQVQVQEALTRTLWCRTLAWFQATGGRAGFAASAGALAGNPFGVDRRAIAADLGMVGGVCPNSMDAVSDRDYVCEARARRDRGHMLSNCARLCCSLRCALRCVALGLFMYGVTV
jgi:hypothetical protein